MRELAQNGLTKRQQSNLGWILTHQKAVFNFELAQVLKKMIKMAI